MHDDLTEQRLASIEAMEATLEAGSLSEEELVAWLGTMNDLRLVLGVRLAVTEESEPEDFETATPNAGTPSPCTGTCRSWSRRSWRPSREIESGSTAAVLRPSSTLKRATWCPAEWADAGG